MYWKKCPQGRSNMSIIKRGTCSSHVVVSESVYSCPDCGYVEMTGDVEDSEKKCPHCDIPMTLMSNSSHTENSEEKDKKDEKDKE